MSFKAKPQAAQIEDEEAPLTNHCLNPANAIAYLRLLLLTLGWILLEMGHADFFFAHYAAQMVLGFLELVALGSDSEAELHR